MPRDEELLPRIQALTAEHPCWGDRRLWAYWRFVEPVPVNKKRVLRLRREHHHSQLDAYGQADTPA